VPLFNASFEVNPKRTT